VKTAFLHGELEKIYMDQLGGFIVPGKEDHVCKLKDVPLWFEIVCKTVV
jgi:hypothetical protein